MMSDIFRPFFDLPTYHVRRLLPYYVRQVIQMNLDVRNCDLRKNLDLRKIDPTPKILVQYTLDLRMILGVHQINLKSRFFLISNKAK